MARTQSQEPSLNQGNRIYLYGLLARELGCGKQTFLPRVEEALAADRMTAGDLGFDNTRALLEAMGDCVNLTVFKGGRIYATVVAQPAWDEALANSVEAKADTAAKGGKPWKRRKADKSLKPVKPRRVKREIADESAAEIQVNVDSEVAASVETGIPAEAEPESSLVSKPETELATPDTPSPVVDVEPEPIPEAEPEPAPKPAPAPEPTTQPTISLTVTYDPYSGSEDETTLEAAMTTPTAAATNEREQPVLDTKPLTSDMPDAKPGKAPVIEPLATDAPRIKPAEAIEPEHIEKTAMSAAPMAIPIENPRRPSAEALKGYPHDFAAEVYCPAEQIAKLSQLLPLGAAVMPLLAEDFRRAIGLELIEGGRSRATFPLRVQHADAVSPIMVTIRKQTGLRLPWTIARVE